MKKRLLIGLLCCVCLGGCAGKERLDASEVQIEEGDMMENEESASTADEEQQQEPNAFGAVPYFDDDPNGLLQYADGWLYGYMDGRIFRVNAETGDTSVLYETVGDRYMNFCIQDGRLYFLSIPQITFVDGVKADLYRMNCDGSECVLLAKEVRIGDTYAFSALWVQMAVYEDTLYIINGDEVSCFQLCENGSAIKTDAKDSLYGLLPEGYSEFSFKLPSIPYCAAHYGYFLARDTEGEWVRVDAKSGECEIILKESAKYLSHAAFISHEGFYIADWDERKWIRYDLEDITSTSCWMEYDPYYNYSYKTDIVGWKEDGAFWVCGYDDEEQGRMEQLLFVDWEGNETPLVSFQKQEAYLWPYVPKEYYFRNGWLYYKDQWEDGKWLMRVSAAGGEPEKIYRYEIQPGEGLTETETVEKNHENTGKIRISTSITKLWLKKDKEGAAKINAALKEIYKAAEAELESDNREMLDKFVYEDGALRENLEEWLYGYTLDEWLTISEETYVASIEYADPDFLCVKMYGDAYIAGGAHGYDWSDYYVFDRHTGRRLFLEDFVNDSPEEIKEIVKAHIVAVAPYSSGGPAEDALEQDRFFLTAEGLGIHYDVYEIGSYADGPYDIIIPFEFFSVKEGMLPDVPGNEEYEILEENISTTPRSVYDNELLSELLASDLEEAQELLDAGITNVPLTAEYFTFDFNDDGKEDYLVSYDGAGWSGVLGNDVSLYIQEDDGLRQVFSCTVRFHVGEGEYVPLTVLKEKTDGFYSFKFAGYDVIWRYDGKDGWYGG